MRKESEMRAKKKRKEKKKNLVEADVNFAMKRTDVESNGGDEMKRG